SHPIGGPCDHFGQFRVDQRRRPGTGESLLRRQARVRGGARPGTVGLVGGVQGLRREPAREEEHRRHVMTGTIVMIGTRKGLWLARSDEKRRRWELDGPHLTMEEVYSCMIDKRNGETRLLAGASSMWLG